MSSAKTVLVVEDDPDLRGAFRLALTLAGFDVLVVGNGLEALHRLDAAPPDIVVLDLGLPIVSGIVVRQQIAASALTHHIPIVVVTGSPQKAQGLGVDCVLTKPVSSDQLVEAVRRCLAAGTSGSGT